MPYVTFKIAVARTVEVQVDALILAGGWQKQLDADKVAEIAESFVSVGQLAPIAITKDRRVLWGHHRIAAAKDVGWKKIRCEIVDASSAEGTEARGIAENLHRRTVTGPERDKLRKRFIALTQPIDDVDRDVAAIQAAELPEKKRGKAALPGRDAQLITRSGAPKKGRPVGTGTKEVAHRKSVARAMVVTEGTLRRSVKRATIAESPPEPPAPVIKTHEIEIPADIDNNIRILAEGLDGIENALKTAQARVTKLVDDTAANPSRRMDLQLLKERLKMLAAAVRDHRPASACVYCKLVPTIVETCTACKATGYLERAQLEDVPKELLIEGEGAGIFEAGQFTKLSELSGKPATKSATKGKRQIAVVDEHGEPLTDTSS